MRTLRPLVQALQALRGVQLIAAMTLVAELQDFQCAFPDPRQLMSYVGLVPGGHSSGPKRRQGSITKAGNSAARRMLVEVASALPAQPAGESDHRCAPGSAAQAVTDIAWAAQLRLNAKFKRLTARRVVRTKAVVAVARELTGFVWAIGREVKLGLAGRCGRARGGRRRHEHRASAGHAAPEAGGRSSTHPRPFPPSGKEEPQRRSNTQSP